MPLKFFLESAGVSNLKNKVLLNTTTSTHLQVAAPALSIQELSTYDLIVHKDGNIYYLDGGPLQKNACGASPRGRRDLVAEKPNLSFWGGC